MMNKVYSFSQSSVIKDEPQQQSNPSTKFGMSKQQLPYEVIKYEKLKMKSSLENIYGDSQLKKHLLESKYRTLQNKLNFVQLSIIFVSSISTFLQAIKSEFKMAGFITDLVFIVVSSYTALILAVSRFLKWESQKEQVSKLIANYAQVVNKIRHQLRKIRNIDIELRDKLWQDILEELDKDNIESDITKYNTKVDTILSANEKVYYQNKLQHLKVKGFINSKYENMMSIISDRKHRYKIPISNYKRKGSLCCCNVKYDTTRFLKDIERITNSISIEKNDKSKDEDCKKYEIYSNEINTYQRATGSPNPYPLRRNKTKDYDENNEFGNFKKREYSSPRSASLENSNQSSPKPISIRFENDSSDNEEDKKEMAKISHIPIEDIQLSISNITRRDSSFNNIPMDTSSNISHKQE
jgi:hypothetical protein